MRATPSPNQLHGPPLVPLQQIHVLLTLVAPVQDTALHVGSHQSRTECRIPSLTLQAMLLSKEPRTGLTFWGVSVHCQLMCSFLAISTLNPSHQGCSLSLQPSPVFVSGVTLTHFQDPYLALLNLMRSMQTHFSRVFSMRFQWSSSLHFCNCSCSFFFHMLCKWILWQLSFQH